MDVQERIHSHHAEARALSGDFQLPLEHIVEPQATAVLKPGGGYISQHGLPFRAEGVVSYRAAHTQVAGNKDIKEGHGWSTVSTAVIEGLNILEVVTADRIVAQVFAEYPLEGYIPKISFLGTRFENLRIAGEPITVKLDIDLFGEKPAGDRHYTHVEEGFLARALKKCQSLCAHAGLPEHTRDTYTKYNDGAVIGEKITNGKASPTETMECSLVKEIEGTFPGTTYGHSVLIPHFGTVHFATVKLVHDDLCEGKFNKTTVELTMIDARLGCIGHGEVSAGRTVTNGSTKP